VFCWGWGGGGGGGPADINRGGAARLRVDGGRAVDSDESSMVESLLDSLRMPADHVSGHR
jgi:hypothetical protein